MIIIAVKNMDKVDIILVTCNRLTFLKDCIQKMQDRIRFTPYRLIIINNDSMDGTTEYLEELKKTPRYEDMVLVNNTREEMPLLSGCYSQGLTYVESEYFICTQDDVIVPQINPDVIQELIRLIDENPRFGAISLRKRAMRVPNTQDEVVRLKTVGAGFRIHKTAEWKEISFGNRRWETLATRQKCVEELKKVVGVATDLWFLDIGRCHNRGYSQEYIDSVKDSSGWQWLKTQPKGYDIDKGVYSDPWVNVPFFLGNNVLGVKECTNQCGSIFRIARTEDVKKIGFGVGQFERAHWYNQVYSVLKKKTGIVPRQSWVTVSEWKNDGNKGYEKDFKEYHTVGVRHKVYVKPE